MRDFMKTFWSAVLSLAAIVALYFGALPLRLEWVFWLVIVVSGGFAGVRVGIPRLLKLASQVREYPNLLRVAAQYQEENEQLRSQVRQMLAEMKERWDKGVVEGRQQVIGGILATTADQIPRITGIDISVGDAVIFLSDWSTGGPRVGARYRVEVRSTRASRGIVEVVSVQESTGLMTLACVYPVSEAFWKHLSERAAFDSSPPLDVELVPQSTEIEALADEPDLYSRPRVAQLVENSNAWTTEGGNDAR